MTRLIKSPQARADIFEIWSYIADDSEQNADAFIDKLDGVFHDLAGQPGMGRVRDELARRIYSFPADGIEIVRVLHGARDIETVFS